MVQQEGFSSNLKQWLAKAKDATTSDATLTLGSLAAAAILGAVVITTPTDAAAWGQVLDALKNVGLGIVANALPAAVERIGKRQGKVTLEAVAQELDEQAATDEQFRKQLDGFVQQLLAGDATLLREVRELHESVVNSGDRHDEKLDRLTAQVGRLLDRATQQVSQITINTGGGSNISGNNSLTALVQNLGGYNQVTIINGKQITPAELAQARASYLSYVVAANGKLDPRGIMQTNRQVLLDMAEVYVNLTAERDDNPNEADRRLHLQQELTRADLSDVEREQRLDDLTARRELARPTHTQVKLDQVVREQPRLVVLGDPGSGKTTLLRYLAYQHATALQQEQPTAGEQGALGPSRLPIYLRIAEYAEALAKAPQRALRDYLAANHIYHACPSEEAVLDRLFNEALARGEAVVLLDGLDEITEDSDRRRIRERIEEFVREQVPHGNQVMVTSRIAGYRAAPLTDEYNRYVIQDMSEVEVETFLRQWVPAVERFLNPEATPELLAATAKKELDSLLAALKNPGVRRLAANPLLLTLLALIHRNGSRLPEKRVELYELAAKTLIARWIDNPALPSRGDNKPFLSEADVLKVLMPLAYCMHARRPSGTVTQQEVQRMIGQVLGHGRGLLADDLSLQAEADEFLRRVQQATGLFVERAPKRYGFMHQTFEEYFAARQLVLRAASRHKMLREVRLDPRWDEVFLLALGFINKDSPEDVGELLYDICLDPQREQPEYEDLPHRDLLLALRACADGILPPQAALDSLLDEAVSLWFEVDEDTGRGRYGLLREQLGSMFGGLAGGEAGKQLAGRLLTRLNDDDRKVRSKAVDALARLAGNDAAVRQQLLALFNDDDIHVRLRAVTALANLADSDEAVRQQLLAQLNDDDREVRSRAVAVLASLAGSDEAVRQRLLDRLNDADRFVRSSAVDALGSLVGSDEAVRLRLLERLDNERDTAVQATLIATLLKLSTSEQQPLRERLYRITQTPKQPTAYPEPYDTAYNALYTSVTEDSRVTDNDALCLPIPLHKSTG